MKRAIDVLCVGHAAFDLILSLDHHPGPDEKCFASGLTTCGGGPAANAAVAVARLGGRSAFCGYLGHDLYGDEHLRELRKERVDVRLVVRGRHPSPLSVILVKPGGERTVVNHKAATPFLQPEDMPPLELSPGVVLFDGHEPFLSVPLAHWARERRIPTVLDAGSVHQGTVELAPLVDYLVASAKFARDFTREADPWRALLALQRFAPFAAVTLGKDGLVWRSGEESAAMPAFPVDAVDTTGAGDTFHGAFALGIARGYSIRKLLRFASAAAALCCTKIGARHGIPASHELEAYLSSRTEP